MNLRFVKPTPRHVGALYRQYSRLTANVPHCLPISETYFGQELLRESEIEVLVAEAGDGEALGCASYTAVSDDFENSGQAVTALFFEDPVAGRALLDECGRRMADLKMVFPAAHGKSPVHAYNAGWNGLSDRLPGIGQVVAQAGFGPYYREMSMICDLAAHSHTPFDIPGFSAQLVEEDGTFRQQAMEGEQKSGLCGYYLLSRYTDDPRARRIGYIDPLWIPERNRRKGLGRMLMLRALAHLRELGCTQCWLTTGADNWPAQPLYLSLGFAFVDCSASFKRP